MATDWFYKAGDYECGPLTGAQLNQMVIQRRIVRDTLVRKGPKGRWIAADQVSDLSFPTDDIRPNTDLTAGGRHQTTPPPFKPTKSKARVVELAEPAVRHTWRPFILFSACLGLLACVAVIGVLFQNGQLKEGSEHDKRVADKDGVDAHPLAERDAQEVDDGDSQNEQALLPSDENAAEVTGPDEVNAPRSEIDIGERAQPGSPVAEQRVVRIKGNPGKDGYTPAILTSAIDQGKLFFTRKLGFADGGLMLTVTFLVFDPSQPDARKLNGLAGAISLENLMTVKNHHLSRRTECKLVRGRGEISLVRPEAKDVNGSVESLDFGSFSPWDLITFLKSEGTVAVILDGEKFELSDRCLLDLSLLAKEVERAWARAGYKNNRAPTVESRESIVAKTMSNSLGMKLVLIPAGKFRMGSPHGLQVDVTLTKGFYLGKTEVTQGQWRAVMETTPWKGKENVREGDNYPANYVNWEDAQAFCKKLSLKEGASYRIPTDAEWEYACRGGTTTRFSFGDDESRLGMVAWFSENTDDIGEEYAHEVGQKQANPFGLYDMHGNVYEWCEDAYLEKLRGGTDPLVSTGGSGRVYRGGGWSGGAAWCSSAYRYGIPPSSRAYGVGFRVARSPSPADLAIREATPTTTKAPKDDLSGGAAAPQPERKTSTVTTVKIPASRSIGAILPKSASTGLQVTKGQKITVTVSGTVRLGINDRKDKGPDELVIAIGNVGKPPLQQIPGGKRIEFTAEHPGGVFLGIRGRSSLANSGEFVVTISVE